MNYCVILLVVPFQFMGFKKWAPLRDSGSGHVLFWRGSSQPWWTVLNTRKQSPKRSTVGSGELIRNHGKLEFHGKKGFREKASWSSASAIMRPGGKAWTATRGKGEAKGCCSFRDSALGCGEGWWGPIAVMRALNICGKPKANIQEPQVLLKAYAANTMFKTRNFNEFQWSPSICSRLTPTPHLKILFYHILKRATQLRTLICTSCASPKLNQPSRWSLEKTCYRKEPSSPQRRWCFWEDDALTIYPVPQHYDATNFWKSEWPFSWIFPTQSKVASFPCHWNQWS